MQLRVWLLGGLANLWLSCRGWPEKVFNQFSRNKEDSSINIDYKYFQSKQGSAQRLAGGPKLISAKPKP